MIRETRTTKGNKTPSDPIKGDFHINNGTVFKYNGKNWVMIAHSTRETIDSSFKESQYETNYKTKTETKNTLTRKQQLLKELAELETTSIEEESSVIRKLKI